jgi:mono/diheme cytochrome c family protein
VRALVTHILVLLTALADAGLGGAWAQNGLTVSGRQGSLQFTASELLADRLTQDVSVAADSVFHRPMTYRAVPAQALLEKVGVAADDYVQARATDGFSIAIPARLLKDARAWLAVEDPAHPWPLLSKGGKSRDIGPFYLVWPNGQGVSSEYWAYQLAALAVTDSPTRRWPQLAVSDNVPAADAVRRGLDRFVAVCIACHRFSGAGEGEQGPDLGRPMNPVDYFQPSALKKLLRDPQSVRSWPERKMPAFDVETLSDGDIDAIVAWLTYKARAGDAQLK